MRHHVMVVEDERTLLRGMLRGLEQLQNVRVTGCESVEEALPVIRRDPPDLLVTDINLPGKLGVELVAALDHLGLHVPVIVVTAYAAEYGSELPDFGAVTVLEKPVPLETLRQAISEELEVVTPRPHHALHLSDYIQLAALGKYSVVLEAAMAGGQVGLIEIQGGDLWNAFYGSLNGLDAISALLREPSYGVRVTHLEQEPAGRQIHESSQSVLLELARDRDEEDRPQACGD